ncbi:uncharacterized protein LOC123898484 [Trifolium pratense]|uniref:uncharacterized protein LOC123898484 n=1 Tax=Trifolium pratense TaxID=57577 RepID=UPI001E690737|nr:uncharacterized protein LOC123898484 [Trifolium pratense]
MDSSDNSHIKIDELEAEYGKFLDECARTYDNYDAQGSSINNENISHTENNINQCTDNVYLQVFGGYTVSGQLTESYVFELTLCDLNKATKTQFTLPSEFSDYVRRYNFHKLVLNVPNKDISIVHLKYPNNPSENVKIARGWKNFCFDNNIKLGDRISFEFRHISLNVCQFSII